MHDERVVKFATQKHLSRGNEILKINIKKCQTKKRETIKLKRESNNIIDFKMKKKKKNKHH